MLTLFWDFNGPILEHYQDHGQAVSSARYCAMLEEKLKPAIRSKHRGMLTDGVVLHRDNARPHTAAATVETIRKLKFELLPHPAHCTDLAPSDYHIFGKIKNALRGRRFANDEEVKDAVHTWFGAQPRTFFTHEIRELVDLSNKCVDKLGD